MSTRIQYRRGWSLLLLANAVALAGCDLTGSYAQRYEESLANVGQLHRHALGQVARLVDVAAAQHGDVIGQQLQRDDDTIGCRNSGDRGT
jgi:hypothetical protein